MQTPVEMGRDTGKGGAQTFYLGAVYSLWKSIEMGQLANLSCVQVSQYCLISTTKANQRQTAVVGECQDVQWAHCVAIGLGLGSFSLLQFRWHCLAARCAFHSLILCLCMQRRLPSMGLATQHPSTVLSVGFTDCPGSFSSVQRDGESRYG